MIFKFRYLLVTLAIVVVFTSCKKSSSSNNSNNHNNNNDTTAYTYYYQATIDGTTYKEIVTDNDTANYIPLSGSDGEGDARTFEAGIGPDEGIVPLNRT